MYKNNFYNAEDLNRILSELVQIRERYRQNKHTLDLVGVISLREDMAIVNSELGEIGADLYQDKIATEATYRKMLLEAQERIEAELKTGKDERGKSWTNIPDRARYRAELECMEYLEASNIAKATHSRAFYLYSKTIPDILNAMSGRIAFLLKLTPAAGATTETPQTGPQRSPYLDREDDGFYNWTTERHLQGISMDELENELTREPEII